MESNLQSDNINITNYNYIKNSFISLLDNNIKTIILVGSGGNGKSYLMKDCANLIKFYDYYICEQISLYISTDEFQEYIESLPPKKILHFNDNPLKYHNIDLPQNSVIINMNHIHF